MAAGKCIVVNLIASGVADIHRRFFDSAFGIFVVSRSFSRPTYKPLWAAQYDWTRQINPWHG